MSRVLFLTFVCCIGAQTIVQPERFQSSELGGDVTIECYLPRTDFNNMVWYKQEMGSKLQEISKSHNYLTKVDFADGYKDGRFAVELERGIYHLRISLLKKEDVATYFCGVISLGELHFGPGTFLMLDEKHTTAVVQEPISEEVDVGDNITLVCSVNMLDEKCEAGHRVFWLRDKSRSSSIYADGALKKQQESCEDDTQTCIHTLTIRSVTLGDAGTYYCAVFGCDKIVFGNGTSLKFSSANDNELTRPLFLTLVSSNLISIIIMILLATVQCKDQSRSSVSFNRSCAQTSEETQAGVADAVTYASVSFSSKSQPSRGAKQHSISQPDVY